MPHTTVMTYLCGFLVFLSICCLSEYTTTHDSKADRSQVGSATEVPLLKDGTSTQESDRDFTEFTTTLSHTNSIESTETPSTTVSPGIVVNSDSGRKCWIILTACFGVMSFILVCMVIPDCLNIFETLRDHHGPICPCKRSNPPETDEYSLSELTPDSLHESINQEDSESETRGSSDSLLEQMTDPLIDNTNTGTLNEPI